MGAGTFPGGFGSGGLDPVSISPRAARAQAPAAIAFNGGTLDHELDDEGHYVGVHPVDATVWLSLRTVLGSIPSAPAVGQGVGLLPYIERAKIQAQVEDRVTTALADLVSRGSVQVLAILVETTVPGRVVFQVSYLNLELATNDNRRTFTS